MKFKISERKKLLIYKILLFVFAFVLAFLPSTVSRNMEVNSRVVVEMLGLDGDDEIEVTAQYVTPTETEGATTKDKVTVKAKTLNEAIERLNIALGRRAELGQCSVIVVGSDVKPQILGTLMTSTDVTADVYLTAAEEKASDLVGDMTEFMKKTGATDADFIAYSSKKAHVATITLLNFLSDLGSASETAYMPLAEMLKEQAGSGGGGGSDGGQSSGGSGGSSGGGSGGEQSGGESEQITGMKIERLALYGREGRAGILESEAARGVAWVSSPIEKSIVTADIDYNGKTVEDVSGCLVKKRSRIKLDKTQGRAVVSLKATVEPRGDSFNKLDAQKDDDLGSAVKQGFADKIEGEIRAAYENSLAMGLDPLFIGREFYRHAPDFFEEKYENGVTAVDFEIEVILK